MSVIVFALLFLSCLIAAPVTAQPVRDDSAAVSAVVSAFHAGLRSGDAAAVMQLIADDALLFEAGGVETRAEYGKNHLPADIEFEKVVASKRSPIRVVVKGDAAWASSTSEFSGTFQGRAVDSLSAELMVLSREAAGWLIRAVHWSGRARKPAQ
jgi:ketosteroid isomerase-like protein